MDVDLEKPFLYRKPPEICRELSDEDSFLAGCNREEFVQNYLSILERQVISYGFKLRLATFDDIIPLGKFIFRRYKKEQAEEVSPYDIYRFIEFGYAVIVEDDNKNIFGCLFEIGYQTPDLASYSIRLGIDEKLNGKNFGMILTMYTCLLAMRRGSKVKRGLIDFDNFANLYIQLNHVGWIVDGFYPEIKGLGSCYTVSLPLTVQGLTSNKVDIDKILNYINTKQENIDYMITDSWDHDKVTRMYRETDFRICAFLKAGKFRDTHYLFALPKEKLSYNNNFNFMNGL